MQSDSTGGFLTSAAGFPSAANPAMMVQVQEPGNRVLASHELAAAVARLSPRSSMGNDEELARALAGCIERARAAWPTVDVPLLDYADFVGERLPEGRDPAAALASARAEDLWIACACTLGNEAGLRALEDRWGKVLLTSVDAVVREKDLAAEAVQRVRERLLLRTGERPVPKIASYRGRGDLGAWLRAAAVRQALDLVRGQRPAQPIDDAGLSVAAIEDDPELTFLKHTYRDQFRTAFDAAFAALDRRQRNLLRMKYLDGASIDVVARLHRVHRSTAARWMTDLREQLMAATRDRMEAALGLPAAEFASVVRLIASQLELSLEAKLRAVTEE